MHNNLTGNFIETELLIIGGGFGGLFAAIKDKQSGVQNITIVDKGAVGLTSQSRLAAGATIYLHPGDDLEEWAKCIFIGQQGLCNQDMVEFKFMPDLPYVLAMVDLEEGIRMMTRIAEYDPDTGSESFKEYFV